jgi:hypothetical protein
LPAWLSLTHIQRALDREGAAMTRTDIEKLAREIAEDHAESEPGIVRVYWFPADEEIRIVEIDESLPSKMEADAPGKMTPFYFQRNGAMRNPLVLELISPDDENKIGVPAGWGDWKDAKVILEKRG